MRAATIQPIYLATEAEVAALTRLRSKALADEARAARIVSRALAAVEDITLSATLRDIVLVVPGGAHHVPHQQV